MFELVPRGLQLSFKFQLDWTYCFGDIAIVRLWHFGWKMPIRANFWRFLGILTPWNCDIVVLTLKEMQYFQKHAFWDITRQNRSSGLTPAALMNRQKSTDH